MLTRAHLATFRLAKRMTSTTLMVGMISSLFIFSGGVVRADDEIDLSPLIRRLESPSSGDRVRGLRELVRLKVSGKQARPILEKLLLDRDAYFRQELVWSIFELLREDGIDLLEKLYNDPDRTVRDSAVRASCRMWGHERSRALCSTAFEDPDYGVRVEVLNTLRDDFARDPKAVALFRRGLEDVSEVVIRSAILSIQVARDGASVKRLGEIAREYSDIAALPATDEALATIGTPEAAAVLLSLLPKVEVEEGMPQRPSELVRAAAARALGRIGYEQALPEVRKLLRDPSVSVKIGAISAVTDMRDSRSVDALIELLKDESTRVRRYTLRAIRNIGDARAADAVGKMMREDAEAEVRASAAVALADLVGEKAIPDLLELKGDLDPSVRLEAVGSLAGLGRPAADALIAFVSDPDAGVRAMSIGGLGQVGGPEQVPALLAAARDSRSATKEIRSAVAQALGTIGGSAAIDALEELAKDAEPGVRKQVATALGRIASENGRETLEALQRDRSASVRDAARRALGRLPADASGN